MREILLAYTSRLIKALGIFTLLAIIYLAYSNQLSLITGLFAGYITGLIWYGVMFGRLWRSADMTVAQAKQQVVGGAIFRLILMGIVLWAAIQVSLAQFLATVFGFGLVYVLGLVFLMMSNFDE